MTFTLASNSLSDGAECPMKHVFSSFGCTGGNVSPELHWSGAPEGTKSFALTVYDPDAPTGSGWWHWVVFNIPPATTSLPKGAGDVKKKLMPKGAIQSRTDFGADVRVLLVRDERVLARARFHGDGDAAGDHFLDRLRCGAHARFTGNSFFRD